MKSELIKKPKESWSSNDVVDFEYFLIHTSSRENPLESAQQARHWFQSNVSDHSRSSDLERPDPFILKTWLNHQKAQRKDSLPFPGDTWGTIISLLHWGALFIGICAGIGLAAGLLQYDGSRPVNVALFFGMLVGVQIPWSILSFFMITGKGFRWIPVSSGLSFRVFRMLLHWASTRMHRHIFSRVSTEKRMVWESFWGHLLKDHGASTKYLIWPILTRIQILGVAFNLGAICYFLASVMFRDLAFGWQTSLQQITHSSVAKLVQLFSLPWNWLLGEGHGYPSMDQIEGSRIVLKEGIETMQNPDLTSWWPFLFFCLVVYGLIPRTLLWLWTRSKERRQLASYPLRSLSSQNLWKRFHTPYLNVTRKSFDEHAHSKDGSLASAVDEIQKSSLVQNSTSTISNIPCWVYLSEDLAMHHANGSLASKLSPHGWQVQGIIDEGILHQDLAHHPFESGEYLLWVDEAWQPPIQEHLKKIEKCRAVLPVGTLLCIGLVGKPNKETWLTSVSPRDLEMWKKFVYQNLSEGVEVRPVVSP